MTATRGEDLSRLPRNRDLLVPRYGSFADENGYAVKDHSVFRSLMIVFAQFAAQTTKFFGGCFIFVHLKPPTRGTVTTTVSHIRRLSATSYQDRDPASRGDDGA